MAIEQKRIPLQSGGTMDYEEMVKTIKYLLDASWGSEWGSLTPEGPNVTDPTNVEYPIILHYLTEMRPGVIGKNGTREIKPRYRYTGFNEDANGTLPPAVTIYGQVFDAEVVFEVWEETNAQVDQMAKQFRHTISAFTGFLKEKGLKEIQFLKMEQNPSSDKVRDAHKIRKLYYFVRFEELTEIPTDIYRVFDVVEERLQSESETQLQKQPTMGE